MTKIWALFLTLFSLALAAAPSQAATPAPSAQDLYIVNPGDVLEVSVWGHENLKRELVVPPDGVISFPLVQEISVQNMTVAGVREAVATKLASFVPDATVTVILLAAKGLNAYVIGKVNRPGQYQTFMDTTVMQALSMAGGLTPFASPDKSFILRHEGGKTVKIPFEYNQVINGKNLEQDVFLRRGDVVVVP